METAHGLTEAEARAVPAGRRIPILFIFDAFPDPHAGTETLFRMLFQQLDRRKFDPRIVLLRKSDYLAKYVPADKLTVLGIWSVRSFAAVRKAWAVLREARRD